ncbi:hypothetical protein PESP_a3190 [Pseudoalteromonas espejiana DSM 9414]|nr:hypothetical protein PESP_a3190 [Pseudoalteromonas espejiana DSM 9414]
MICICIINSEYSIEVENVPKKQNPALNRVYIANNRASLK